MLHRPPEDGEVVFLAGMVTVECAQEQKPCERKQLFTSGAEARLI